MATTLTTSVQMDVKIHAGRTGDAEALATTTYNELDMENWLNASGL
jgi:hypothetical protein